MLANGNYYAASFSAANGCAKTCGKHARIRSSNPQSFRLLSFSMPSRLHTLKPRNLQDPKTTQTLAFRNYFKKTPRPPEGSAAASTEATRGRRYSPTSRGHAKAALRRRLTPPEGGAAVQRAETTRRRRCGFD